MSEVTKDDKAPPKLSKEQIKLILTSPIHRKIKHQVYSILGISVLGCLASLVIVVLGSILAKHIVQEHRWLISHYTMAAIFVVLWAVYCTKYYWDLKMMAWIDQLKIDGGWIGFAVVFSSCFLFYLYYKLRTYATLEALGENCAFSCETDLSFVRLAPLIMGIANILLLAIQIYLLVMLSKNPIINPPLDEHGMPVPINPLNGERLPIGPDGKPILPPELRPQTNQTKTKPSEKDLADDTNLSDASTLSPSEDSDAEERTLIDADGVSKDKSAMSQKELGSRRGSRRSGGRREGSTRRNGRGYDAV